MRILLKAVVLLALGAVGVWGWSHLSRPAPLWTERRGQLEALVVADTVTADQKSWRDWSSRMFVPISALDAIGQQYVGTVPCADPEQTALIADGFEFGPTNDLVIFAQTFAAIVASGGAEAVKQTRQWFDDAVAHPTNPPTPPPSVGQAVMDAAAKRVGIPGIPVANPVKPPVSVSDNCVEHCPPVGPCVKVCR